MDSTGPVRLSIGCARAIRLVTIARTSAAPAATLSIWTSSAARVLPSRFNPSAMRVIAQTAAYDSLLDGIAFSRGRFAVSMPGSPTLVLATAPQVARVVEDCRS
jgi:hypothetical protein